MGDRGPEYEYLEAAVARLMRLIGVQDSAPGNVHDISFDIGASVTRAMSNANALANTSAVAGDPLVREACRVASDAYVGAATALVAFGGAVEDYSRAQSEEESPSG